MQGKTPFQGGKKAEKTRRIERKTKDVHTYFRCNKNNLRNGFSGKTTKPKKKHQK